jgi:hypothetical protein
LAAIGQTSGASRVVSPQTQTARIPSATPRVIQRIRSESRGIEP